MDDQRKDRIDEKKNPLQRNRSKQLRIHNISTYDMENTHGTNKGRYLLFANKLRVIPWVTERIPKRIQRHRKATLHWSVHPQQTQDLTEESN